MLRRWILLQLTLCTSACFSGPLPLLLLPQQQASLETCPKAPLAVHVQCEQRGREFELACDQTVDEVTALLSRSHWFGDVNVDSDMAALILTVEAPVRRPYWSKPAHNPAFLLLSAAIPFWWKEPFGYRMSARAVDSGKEIDVDTTREGTSVMWGLASVFNLSPNRSSVPHPERELHQIEAQLLPIFGCRGAEVCLMPGFRKLSFPGGEDAPRSIEAARQWLAANSHETKKLLISVRSIDGGAEIDVMDEVQCHAGAAIARGCAGTFCATHLYDSKRDKIERATYWR